MVVPHPAVYSGNPELPLASGTRCGPCSYVYNDQRGSAGNMRFCALFS